VSTRRQALKPFFFKDGTKIATGDWACTPVRAIMQDEHYYPSPLDFNGFRFVDPELLVGAAAGVNKVMQPEPSKLTDIGYHFHVWGTGRMAW
jgi:cytochrome P450